MSMGGSGGGGGQMPMASNRGQQQQQQQQMMDQPQGMMPPQGMPQGMMSGIHQMQPMPPSGGMDVGAVNDHLRQMAQMMQQAQQQQMMGGGNAPYQMAQPVPAGNPMSGAMDQPEMSGIQGLMANPNTAIGMMANPNAVDMKPTTMANPNSGMPPAYRPTSGPIDGRKLRDQMDVSRVRPMGRGDDRENGGLPGSIANDLPSSLKRPTQGDYKNFK